MPFSLTNPLCSFVFFVPFVVNPFIFNHEEHTQGRREDFNVEQTEPVSGDTDSGATAPGSVNVIFTYLAPHFNIG